MAATKTNLRTEIATRADMVTFTATTHVNITECDTWIDEAHTELYGILVQTYPDIYSAYQDHTLTSTGILTPSPAIYKIRAIDNDPDTNYTRAVERLNFAERNSLRRLCYRDMGSTIAFLPKSQASGARIRLWYVPTLTLLTSLGSDTLDDKCDEYREFIVLECAAKALHKDKDPEGEAALRARKAEIERRLIEQLPEDVGAPEQVGYIFGADGSSSFDQGPA